MDLTILWHKLLKGAIVGGLFGLIFHNAIPREQKPPPLSDDPDNIEDEIKKV